MSEPAPIRPVEIYCSDKNSVPNKDLCDFLFKALRDIILKGNMKIKWKIVKTTEDKNMLKKKKIENLPALIVKGQKPIVKTDEIIKFFRFMIQNNKQVAAPKSDEEIIREMQEQSLGPIKKDMHGRLVPEDDTDKNTFDPTSKLNAELEKRRLMGGVMPDNQSDMLLKRTPPPAGASWKPTPDFDDYERQPPIHNGRRDAESYGEALPRSRADNVGDNPILSLQKLNPQNSDQSTDDALMNTLLMNQGSGGY
jgi:hypothetical protein